MTDEQFFWPSSSRCATSCRAGTSSFVTGGSAGNQMDGHGDVRITRTGELTMREYDWMMPDDRAAALEKLRMRVSTGFVRKSLAARHQSLVALLHAPAVARPC